MSKPHIIKESDFTNYESVVLLASDSTRDKKIKMRTAFGNDLVTTVLVVIDKRDDDNTVYTQSLRRAIQAYNDLG